MDSSESDRVSRYKLIKTIGQGASGIIALAFDQKTSEHVAIKIINRKDVAEKQMLKYLESELRLIARINHPSFPKVYDIIYTEESILIVMEYLANGSILDVVHQKLQFTYKEKIDICIQILEGLEYLHDRGIAHRDIKPENIVFDKYFHPKIIDFGMSHENADKLSTYCGTPNYMAPEIVNTSCYNGKRADVWSFGVTAHILMCQKAPLNYPTELKYVREVRKNNLKVSNQCYGEFGNIIEACLNKDPEQRPSIQEILKQMRNLSYDDSPISTKSHKEVLPKLVKGGAGIRACNTERFSGFIQKIGPNYRVRKVGSI